MLVHHIESSPFAGQLAVQAILKSVHRNGIDPSFRTYAECRFKDNAARLQLFALAYNLTNFLRQLVLPNPIRGWTLTTLREKLIRIGAKVTAHAKYVTFQLAEVAVPRQLFAQILERIARLCPTCASG